MTTPHYTDGPVTIWHGDCLDVMRRLPDGSVDAVVTDPPYGLEFMGREWDSFRSDDPGTNRHRGDRAGSQGTKGTTDERWTGADGRSMPSNRLNYGGGKRPTTSRCLGCGKRDQRRNPHACPEGTDWAVEILNPNAAPPTMLAFQNWTREWAAEAYRLLKPGGHLLAFGGTRTFHRLTAGIEDAGFEIRDSIAWLYGSGFPKSLDVGKAIDRIRDDAADHAAVARFLVDQMTARGITRRDVSEHFGMANGAQQWTTHWTDGAVKPRVPSVEQWAELRTWLDLPDDMDAEVWRLNGRKGTPGDAYEQREILATREVGDIRNGHGRATGSAMLAGEKTGKIEHRTTAPATADAARWNGWGTALKPSHEPIVVARKPLQGTVAANVLAYGTGALNIDGSRIGTGGQLKWSQPRDMGYHGGSDAGPVEALTATQGRWPANVILDASQAAALDAQSGYLATGTKGSSVGGFRSEYVGGGVKGDFTDPVAKREAGGGASRFFKTVDTVAPRFMYTAKAGSDERPGVDGVSHPTVKPVDLMRWLVKLVTPPSVTVCPRCQGGKHEATGEGDAARLRDVWDDVQAEGQLQAGEVLLEDMRRPGADAPAAGVRAVRNDVPAEVAQEPLLFADLWSEGERTSETEGAVRQPSRLRDGLRPDASNGDANRLHPGTPPRHGGAPGSATDLGRGRSSPQRSEDGQPAGELAGAPEAGTRPNLEARTEADHLPPLRRADQGLGTCPTCGSDLIQQAGTILEPFAGSGSTVEAAVLEGFRCIAIEREGDYLPLILQRIRKPHAVGLDLDWDAPTPAPTPIRPAGGRTGPRSGTPAPTPGFDFGDDWELDA